MLNSNPQTTGKLAVKNKFAANQLGNKAIGNYGLKDTALLKLVIFARSQSFQPSLKCLKESYTISAEVY